MTLTELNRADLPTARAALLRCCGSGQWTEAMLGLRPFSDPEALQSSAETVWWALTESDWLEAFAAHPRIGERKAQANPAAEWSNEEQSGVLGASAALQKTLEARNGEYEQRFGWIFLIQASGKSADEMLRSVELRLGNRPDKELRVAAGEQAKITALRLRKLLTE